MTEWQLHPVNVALVGRVNVGKSTIFNKLTEKTRALVSRIPGTTRDVNQGVASWKGKHFTLIDTGGWSAGEKDSLTEKVKSEALKHALKADLAILVVDAKDGILKEDKMMAEILRKNEIKTILVVNKVEVRETSLGKEYYRLGIGEPILTAAVSGRGLGDLLDKITENISNKKLNIRHPLVVAILGKPNVGKSSMINAIADKEAMLVSEIPGTTREPHPVFISKGGKDFLFVDTAGIRKKWKGGDVVERDGITLSIDITRDADVNWLVFDISEPLTSQDKALAEEVSSANRALVIVANKWDRVPKKTPQTQVEMLARLTANFRTLSWAESAFTSASTKYGFDRLIKLSEELNKKQNEKLDKEELEILWKAFVRAHPAKRPGSDTHKISLLSFSQVSTRPLTFAITIKTKDFVPQPLLNKLENELRRTFKLKGVPIILKLKRARL